MVIQCLIVALAVLFTACTREGSREQITAFNHAVALEAQTQSIPDRQAAYMKVVAMDPNTKYGKAAATRVEQLNRQLESLLRGRP